MQTTSDRGHARNRAENPTYVSWQSMKDDPTPAAVVRVLDKWAARTHGVLGGTHQAGLFLELLRDAGYQVAPAHPAPLESRELTEEEYAELERRFRDWASRPGRPTWLSQALAPLVEARPVAARETVVSADEPLNPEDRALVNALVSEHQAETAPTGAQIRAYLDRNPATLRAAIQKQARIDPGWLRRFLQREKRRNPSNWRFPL